MENRNWGEINKKFNRNALGRLVNNSEKVQGLPLTLEEEMNKLPLDDQITFLTNRLEEIGGCKFRAAEFEFDEGPSWPGFTTGQTWNGWACPWMSKEVVLSVLDWMGESNCEDYSLTYEVEGDLITLIDSTYPEEPWTLEPDENGLYNMGGMWTWNEKAYYCALCNCTYDPKDSGATGEFCSQSCKEEAMEENNLVKVKLLGFKVLKPENFEAAFKWMAEEGTCCLAYGDWTVKGYELLLTEEQKAYHKSDDLTRLEEEEWSDLDEEICEALIMLPVIRNLCATSLYWDCIKRKISTEYFEGAQLGFDFGDNAHLYGL